MVGLIGFAVVVAALQKRGDGGQRDLTGHQGFVANADLPQVNQSQHRQQILLGDLLSGAAHHRHILFCYYSLTLLIIEVPMLDPKGLGRLFSAGQSEGLGLRDKGAELESQILGQQIRGRIGAGGVEKQVELGGGLPRAIHGTAIVPLGQGPIFGLELPSLVAAPGQINRFGHSRLLELI